MFGRSSPKSEAIAIIFEAGLYGLVFDAQKVWIYYQLLECWRYELLSLLLVSFETMCGIEFSNLLLGSINRNITKNTMPQYLHEKYTRCIQRQDLHDYCCRHQ